VACGAAAGHLRGAGTATGRDRFDQVAHRAVKDVQQPSAPRCRAAPRPGKPPSTTKKTAELGRYKLAPHTGDDPDGYHRAMCPATAGKVRCPLRPESMILSRDRPEIPSPPEHPPACCTQQTITIPPQAGAKTRQKHHYPGPEWRRSYARRTSAERAFATIKDPATTSTTEHRAPTSRSTIGPPAHPLPVTTGVTATSADHPASTAPDRQSPPPK
jgi:hypothetical protein